MQYHPIINSNKLPLNAKVKRNGLCMQDMIKDDIERIQSIRCHFGLGAGITGAVARVLKLPNTVVVEDYCKNMCHAAMETGPINSA